jgi:hypothetical protein
MKKEYQDFLEQELLNIKERLEILEKHAHVHI